MSPTGPWTIEPPYYPIVYVRGYAMLPSEREETFYDAYYGFAVTSVEKRDAPKPKYFEVDIFEGQLIRFMKLPKHRYADATNEGLQAFSENPSRSLWVCRFYDKDVASEKLRSIEEHAQDLAAMVREEIPNKLKDAGVDLGPNDRNYKVILIAHSMGGLVCRTLIQNLLPDPKRWIHRLVTIGTPHKGIDLGRIPNWIENTVVNAFNPFDASIFQESRMRTYLKLSKDYDVHSLGDPSLPQTFPVKRCFCVIGSDYRSYSAVQHATGDHSDGLVKQSQAYVVSGPRPASGDYPDGQVAFWANVHRAHSGRRGIVNSYETFENIQRFLFGDTRAEIALENLRVTGKPEKGEMYFYDFECLFSVRGTGVYLHQRQQDPCENAWRFARDPKKDIDQVPDRLVLHTGFMDSKLRSAGAEFSRFSIRLRVIAHRVQVGRFWDHEYAGRPIYDETAEIFVGDVDVKSAGDELAYVWLSEGGEPKISRPDAAGIFRIPLRAANTISAELVIRPSVWPDAELTKDKEVIS